MTQRSIAGNAPTLALLQIPCHIKISSGIC
jgi:hypothetical protein